MSYTRQLESVSENELAKIFSIQSKCPKYQNGCHEGCQNLKFSHTDKMYKSNSTL